MSEVVARDQLIQIRALSTRMSRTKIAKTTGIDKNIVDYVIDELKKDKDFGQSFLNDKASAYVTDDIRPGKVVVIHDPRKHSSYFNVHGEKIKILEEYPTLFIGKTVKSNYIITIPKADIHTKSLDYKFVS